MALLSSRLPRRLWFRAKERVLIVADEPLAIAGATPFAPMGPTVTKSELAFLEDSADLGYTVEIHVVETSGHVAILPFRARPRGERGPVTPERAAKPAMLRCDHCESQQAHLVCRGCQALICGACADGEQCQDCALLEAYLRPTPSAG